MITALVLYDLPAHIGREACREHFLKIAPDFLDVPGFIRKQFIHDVNGGVAGGCYIWENLAAAKAFYKSESFAGFAWQPDQIRPLRQAGENLIDQ